MQQQSQPPQAAQPQQIVFQQPQNVAQQTNTAADPNMVQFITQQEPGQPPRVVQVIQAPNGQQQQNVGTPTVQASNVPAQFVPVQHIQQQQFVGVPVQAPTPSSSGGTSPGVGEDPRNLIVNYVPTPVTDHELRQLFEQYGELESARVICDRVTGHPKGYGFVKYKDPAGAKAAMENMNGFELYNKRLKVTTAKGPQNAAINQHTNRLQQVVQQASSNSNGMVVMQQPPPMQVQVPGGAQQSAQTQGVAPYVVLKSDSQQPTFGGVAMPSSQQQVSAQGTGGISTITFQPPQQQQQVSGQSPSTTQPPLQMFVPLSNSNDPMQRDSCYFSVGQSQQLSQISSQQGLSGQFSNATGQ